MAVIQKIRNKYGKIAAGVIVLSLVGFILMDATSSGRIDDLFQGGRDVVVKVNGEKVEYKVYIQRQHEYEVLYGAFNPDFKMTDQTRAQINDQVLRELIYEKLVDDECEKLGIGVSKEEEKELIYGAEPDQLIKQFPYFANRETKMFDPAMVKQFEQALKTQGAEIDPQGKLAEQWEILKAFAVRSYRTNKYNAAVTAGITAPQFMVDQDVKLRQQMANISYVMVPYAIISDEQAKVSDDELKAYMEKHKAEYTVKEPSRSIEYVSFDITPNGEDSAKSLGELIKLKNEFATATDIEKIVNSNSDENYKDVFVNKRIYQSRFSDSILNLPVGGVYGPYYDEGDFKLSKIVERKTYPDSVKFRLIRVATKADGQDIISDSAAKMRIDSAIAALNSGAPFAEVANRFSDDQNRQQTGGEYTYTIDQKSQLPEALGTAIFDGVTGDKKSVSIKEKTYESIFYVEILEQKGIQPAVKIATIVKSLSAGTATDQAVYGKANEFAGKNATAKAFDEAAKTHPGRRMAENIKQTDFVIEGLGGGSTREVVRWAYEAKLGDVSNVFNMDGRYVVAKLSSIQEKGLPKITEANRPALEKKVKDEKKAKIIADTYKGMKSLNDIAVKSGQAIQQADSISAGGMYVPKLGYEPRVLGYSFFKGLQPNAISPAIKGNEAVFFISVANRWEGPAPTMPGIMENEKAAMEGQIRNAASGTLMQMLRDKADIEYNVKNL